MADIEPHSLFCRIAQIVSGVVQEHIVQGRALHADFLNLNIFRASQIHQRRYRRWPIVRNNMDRAIALADIRRVR